MQTLHETDEHFASLGATHYHDAHYPEWVTYGYRQGGGLFSRHYFNAQGTEIGYVLPDFLQFEGHGVHHFETPRVWGIPHEKIALAV